MYTERDVCFDEWPELDEWSGQTLLAPGRRVVLSETLTPDTADTVNAADPSNTTDDIGKFKQIK